MHAGAYRPAGKAALALRGMPVTMPGGSRHSKTAGVARPVDAEAALETALLPAPGGMSPLRSAGGRLSVGGALGAGHHGAVQCCGRVGAGVELAGHGARVRAELEKRGHDSEALAQRANKANHGQQRVARNSTQATSAPSSTPFVLMSQSPTMRPAAGSTSVAIAGACATRSSAKRAFVLLPA